MNIPFGHSAAETDNSGLPAIVVNDNGDQDEVLRLECVQESVHKPDDGGPLQKHPYKFIRPYFL